MPLLAAHLLRIALALALAGPEAVVDASDGAAAEVSADDAVDDAVDEATTDDAADDVAAPTLGPPPPETIRERPPAPTLRADVLDRQRQTAIGLLIAAGVADAVAFTLRGVHYHVLTSRCAEDPAIGALPADTACPNLLALNVLGGAHTLANVGLYALAIEGGKGLGRQRADRVRAGLAPAHDHARALKIALPIAYFTTVGAFVLGGLVFFDNVTSPSPGTELRAPPTRTPAFDPLLQFGTQAAMTVSAAWIAVAMRSRSYRIRLEELDVTAAAAPIPGGATFGIFGRF